MSNGPKTPEEALEHIKKAVEEGNIEFAPFDEIDALQPYVDKILRAVAIAMGRNPDKFNPLVTDYSAVSDFAPLSEEEGDFDAFLKTVGDELGITIERGHTGLVDIAKRLQN